MKKSIKLLQFSKNIVPQIHRIFYIWVISSKIFWNLDALFMFCSKNIQTCGIRKRKKKFFILKSFRGLEFYVFSIREHLRSRYGVMAHMCESSENLNYTKWKKKPEKFDCCPHFETGVKMF